MGEEIVYVKAEKNSAVMNRKIFLEDIIKIYGTNKKLIKELNGRVALIVEKEKKQKFCFSILKIMEIIHVGHPGITIENVGEIDFIVEYIPPQKKKVVAEWIKTILVCIAVFIGAAFTIMTFNEDVSVDEVFKMFYELVTGDPQNGGSILEISYSIGLPLGIILFFNHFSRAKIDSDPTPLQVRQRVYEEDVNKTIIENASREKKTLDV